MSEPSLSRIRSLLVDAEIALYDNNYHETMKKITHALSLVEVLERVANIPSNIEIQKGENNE